jgi:protein-S-isoprenylcysteine O-methyltransferase Ste14
MGRLLTLLYGSVIYGAFLVTFLYAMGFVSGFFVPKTVNSGTDGPLVQSILINVALLGLFAIQHLIMARTTFKAWWTKFVPKPIERSTFVLATCLCLGLMYWQWQPMTGVVWNVENPAARAVLVGVGLVGWLTVLYSTFLIDHFDLFGLRQVVLYWRRRIAFWATPMMTTGHLLFAIVTTAYIVVGTRVEEQTLLGMLGDEYRDYRRRTWRFLPLPRRPKAVEPQAEAAAVSPPEA